MAASFSGGEKYSPGEESVCIEVASQHTEENEDPDQNKEFRVKYKGRSDKERKLSIPWIPHGKLVDSEPEKELADNMSLQKLKLKPKSACEAEKESADNVSLQKLKSKPKSTCEGYTLSEKNIGTAIIINNLDNEQPATRADVDILSDLLKKIGFQTHVYLNYTKKEMMDLKENVILNEKTHEDSSTFVLVVIAHGKEDSKDRHVMSTNKISTWFMKKVESQLNDVKTLKGKPKVIIVEACRGEKKMKMVTKMNDPDGAFAQKQTQRSDAVLDSEDEGDDDQDQDEDENENDENTIQHKNKGGKRVDQGSYTSIKPSHNGTHAEMKDQLVCLATVQNYVALTLKKSGSVFIQRLAKLWKELVYLEQMTEILSQVTNNVANKPVKAQREECQVQVTNNLANNPLKVQKEECQDPQYMSTLDEHSQGTNNLANKPLKVQKELCQCPQYMSTLDKHFNIKNYVIEKAEDFAEPMKGHVYLKSPVKRSIIGQGYSTLKKQLKHYNVFETYNYEPEYEPHEGERQKESYHLPKGVEVRREITEQSYIEYMPNPAKKDGIATITYHKEYRTACVSFKDNLTKVDKSSTQQFLGDNSQLAHHFKDVLKLDVENGASKELTEKNIEDFFDFFDQNYIRSHYMGGSVSVTILVNSKSEMLKDTKNEEEILKNHLDNIFSRTAINDETLHVDFEVDNIEFQGGIIKDVPENFKKITQSQISTWIESIHTNPVPLKTEMILAPIHLVVAEVDSQKGEMIMKEGRKSEKEEKTNEGREGNEGRKTSFLFINNTKDGVTDLAENTVVCGNKLVKYVGDMEKSQRHGDGRGYFRNGDVYIGQWRKGKPEGLGTWYYTEGNHIRHMRGIFKDGEKPKRLYGWPKKKVYEKRSFWLKSFIFLFALIAMGVLIGWALWPPPPTCTGKISEEWDRIYFTKGQKPMWARAYVEFDMSKLSNYTKSICNGTTVYMDDLPFPSDLDSSAIGIPNDDPSRVHAFNFSQDLKTVRILHPHGDKEFRIRSCKTGTDCRMSLTNSTHFFCVDKNKTKFRNLTCPETIVHNWENINVYNQSSAILTVDLTNLTDRCHLGLQPVYMEVVAVSKDRHIKWRDCQNILDIPSTLAFSQVFEFNKTNESEDIKFLSGRFIIRFNQGDGSYDCTHMLSLQDQQENDIYKAWTNTGNNTNKINPGISADKLYMKIDPEESTDCTLNLKQIPLYQTFMNISYLDAQVNFFPHVNKTGKACSRDPEVNIEKNGREKIWVTKSSTYINFNQISLVGANSTYCLTIYPDYPFCGHREDSLYECHYQAILECSNCRCNVKSTTFPHNSLVITDSDRTPIDNFWGYYPIKNHNKL